MTENLKLRKYQLSDLDKIEDLMRSHFDNGNVPKRKLIFDWIASHDPAAGDETCYLVIEDRDKIVAYEGRMPVDLMINGEKEKGYFFHDTLVHPEYRKKGLGLTLVSQLKSTWENATHTFAIGVWMNQFTYEILKRRGYHELSAPYFVKPLNFGPCLKKVVSNKFLARPITSSVKCLSDAYDYCLFSPRYPDISISQISRFDRRFDDFADRISPKFNLIVVRHSRYLNWKYVDRPFSNYAIFASEKDNELVGYIVLLLTEMGDIRVGVIVDILADPHDSRTISCLCQLAIKYFKGKNADFIVCVLTNKQFIGIFKRHLFVKRRKTAPVMVANLHKHHAQDLLKDISNWFLTCGDSDGFSWQ